MNEQQQSRRQRGLQGVLSDATVESGYRPDHIDRMVYSATQQVRNQYIQSCANLHLQPRDLSPVVIGMRSVR